MDNSWELKYQQLLVTYEEFQRSTRELEEDLESDVQQKEEQLLAATRQVDKLKFDLADLHKSSERDRHTATLQNDRLLTQVQVLKDNALNEKKARTRLEQANEDLEGHLRILQKESEEATERLEAALEDQVIAQQDYEDLQKELQQLQSQLQKAERLVENMEQQSSSALGAKALIDNLRAEIDDLKQQKLLIKKNSEEAMAGGGGAGGAGGGGGGGQPTARMRRLEGLQKIAKQREERLLAKRTSKQGIVATGQQQSNLVAKSGMLDKKEQSLRSWKSQFCEINVTDRTLELFMVITGALNGNVHKKVGSVRLSGCQLVVKHREKRQFALQPSHSKNKTVFRCQSDGELEAWVDALQLAITDVAQGPEAAAFLKIRARSSTSRGPNEVASPSSSSSSEISAEKAAFVWQKDSSVLKEAPAMKLKFGCEGNEQSDWEPITLRLSNGSSLIDVLSASGGEKRGAIPLVVHERGEVGLSRVRTADTLGAQSHVIAVHTGAFEHVLAFSSFATRMEWLRTIRFCLTARDDVRLEGTLSLPKPQEDTLKETYCMLLLSRVNPGIMNFFDPASNESSVVRCLRLARNCQLTVCSDPCAFTLTQTDTITLRARDPSEAKQWMAGISAVLSELEEPSFGRESVSGRVPEEGLPRSASDAFSFVARVSVSGECPNRISVDATTRSKSGRLLEMSNNLVSVNWKPRFFSIEATSRMLEYSQAVKRCASKNCNAMSEVSGGYCQQCMRKIMDGEDDEPRRLSRTASFLARLGTAKMEPARTLPSQQSERERKAQLIPLARATVVALAPKKAGGRSNCFLLTPYHSKREYILQAADEQDMLDWIEVLSSRTKVEELPPISLKGFLSLRSVRATGTMVPWKQRWFVLENSNFSHRKSEQDKASQAIPLTHSCQVGVLEETASQFEFYLNESDKDTFHFAATDKAMGKRWLAALERVIRHEKSMNAMEGADEPLLSISPAPSPRPSSPFSAPPSPSLSPSPPSPSLTPASSPHFPHSSPSHNHHHPHPPPPHSPSLSPQSSFSSSHHSSSSSPAASSSSSPFHTSSSPFHASSSPSPSPQKPLGVPPRTALAFDLSASRLETELMQQKAELEAQLVKREAELRQRDAELQEAKRLIIHLNDKHQQPPPPGDRPADRPVSPPAVVDERRKPEEGSKGAKTTTSNGRRGPEEEEEEEEEGDLEKENSALRSQLLAEKQEKARLVAQLEAEKHRAELILKSMELETEKRTLHAEERDRMKIELEKERKKFAQGETQKKKLKAEQARLHEEASREAAEKRKVQLENQWLAAEADKQRLLREQAELQRQQADKQRLEAETEKKQAERQRQQSEKQRIEAETERKRLATEAGRRAHLQNQWMLAEQEKQLVIEAEKLRIAQAEKELKEKELVMALEKQKLLEKEEAKKLIEQDIERKLTQFRTQQLEAEREKQVLREQAEKAEREKELLRVEAERERVRLKEESEREKLRLKEEAERVEREKARLREEAEKAKEEAEREKARLKEETEKAKEESERQLQAERRQLEQEKATLIRAASLGRISPPPESPVTPQKRDIITISTPRSPPLVRAATLLEVPQSNHEGSPSADSGDERSPSSRRNRKSPGKFGTLQNLQKPIDVASLRNIFETQEKTPASPPPRTPPPPPR